MQYLTILLATVASFAAGAVYYGSVSKVWVKASGVPTKQDGTPKNSSNPLLYVSTFLCQLVVAAMMFHAFSFASVTGLFTGASAGFSIGLFLITPWIALNILYSMRAKSLILIDGGYATLACTIKGAIIGLL